MIKITRRGKKAWVTFTAPVEGGEKVELKGSWNGWEPEAMKRKKSGEFYLTKIFKVGEEHEFGYLVDGTDWLHDPDTGLVETPFGSKNSVLKM